MNRLLLAPTLWSIATIFTALVPPGSLAAGPPTGLYFGQTPPGSTPEVFAPDLISRPNRYEYSIAFSPDLTECVFGVTNSLWSSFDLRFLSMAADSTWIGPVTAPFLGTGDGLNPAYSYGGERVFFASTRPSYPPSNLWTSERDGLGGWTAPVMVPAPVSTTADEWAPSFDSADVMYFVSYRVGGLGDGDIYRSVPVGGVYTTVENAGVPLNTPSLDSTPFISPDGGYILFESDRTGGFGQGDLYISYRAGDGWSTPLNLGPEINTDQIEDEAYVSPDGQYLFFNRRRAFVTSEPSDLWWVDVGVLPGATAVSLDAAVRPSVLAQNAPNPFDPSTEITYTLPSPGFVAIQILDVRGRHVRSLVQRHQGAGTHSVTLTGSEARGLAGGPYFYRLVLNGETLATRKMTRLR